MSFIRVTAVHWYPDNEYKQQWIAFKVRNLYYECAKVSWGISEKIDVKVCLALVFYLFMELWYAKDVYFFSKQ